MIGRKHPGQKSAQIEGQPNLGDENNEKKNLQGKTIN